MLGIIGMLDILKREHLKIKIFLDRVSKGYTTASEIARNTDISPQGMSDRVKRLKEAGFITTKTEGRYNYIEITDKAKDFINSINNINARLSDLNRVRSEFSKKYWNTKK